MHCRRLTGMLVLAVLLPAPASAATKYVKVTVHAGEYERRGCPVSFDFSATGLPLDSTYSLRDGKGGSLPLQVEGQRAWFIEPGLENGRTKTYVLGAEPSRERVTVAAGPSDAWRFASAGKTLLAYQGGKGTLPRPEYKPIFRRGGYVHPLVTLSGITVTDDYPTNHVHHHGVWFAWTKTEFEGRQPDFWNMGQGTGTVEFERIDRHWNGPVHAGLVARHRYVDLSATPARAALKEQWSVRAYDSSVGVSMFDLESRQECADGQPLKLPKYHYGGLGVRGHGEWNGNTRTFFLTDSGETDRVAGNEQRGRWCYMSGDVAGKRAGILILGHPDNFRAPQPMRLHPSEPFFCFAPSQLGDWEIAPGRAYVSRYRLIAREGSGDQAEFNRLWNDYAHPPRVTVE